MSILTPKCAAPTSWRDWRAPQSATSYTDRTIELPSRGVVALTPLQFSGERPSIYRVSDTRCVEEEIKNRFLDRWSLKVTFKVKFKVSVGFLVEKYIGEWRSIHAGFNCMYILQLKADSLQ
ncbi:unnamed protein product [Trichogramma brassicae]|uniref:Uncharacterized protein n=1 Tax=Trichogramma brassicae TaxID=86971 RepID=A0A6H5IKM1_9HYME|nr:unnamed protein product [Trichogramma brassicae]